MRIISSICEALRELEETSDFIRELWKYDFGKQYLQSRGIQVNSIPDSTPSTISITGIHKIGDIVDINGEKGYVVALYDNGSPKWLMSVKEYGRGISWRDAMKLKLPLGWIIPSREQFFEVRNSIQKMLEDGMLSTDTFGIYLWSSSEYSSSDAWYLGTASGGVYNRSKDDANGIFRVRAFFAIQPRP